MGRGVVRVVAAVPYGTADRVQQLVAAERRRLKDLLKKDKRWNTSKLPRTEAAIVREQKQQWINDQREAGTLLDTNGVVLTIGIRAELKGRGWDHSWPPSPPQASLAGRWPGSRDGGYPDRVAANLPLELVTQVWAACWHTSAPAIEALRNWRDEHPTIVRASVDPDEAAALREYERLAAEVTVPGEIWRAGIARVVDS
jgi:hypothetical protein